MNKQIVGIIAFSVIGLAGMVCSGVFGWGGEAGGRIGAAAIGGILYLLDGKPGNGGAAAVGLLAAAEIVGGSVNAG